MKEVVEFVVPLTEPKVVAAAFAFVALLMAVPMIWKGSRQAATQLLGSLLVVAISFAANHWAVYTIAVFVIATLVTELQFLEKIAALIWNRKEYWNYLLGVANEADIKSKIEAEVESEFQRKDEEGPDEAEAMEEVVEEPEGITEKSPENEPLDRSSLVASALQFEKLALDTLVDSRFPFPVKKIRREVRLSSGEHSYVVDAIVEGQDNHYLIEVKNASRPSALLNGVQQLKLYESLYRSYLQERNVRVNVQPLLLVPAESNVSGQFRGIPVVKFDPEAKAFSNLRSQYPDYDIAGINMNPTGQLSSLLVDFLTKYGRWAFSPLRIQKWGGRQPGFEKLGLYTVNEIRSELIRLLAKGVVREVRSRKGNQLFRINL